MTTAREQAREAVFAACKPYADEEDEFYLAADAASDVWEPLMVEAVRLLRDHGRGGEVTRFLLRMSEKLDYDEITERYPEFP